MSCNDAKRRRAALVLGPSFNVKLQVRLTTLHRRCIFRDAIPQHCLPLLATRRRFLPVSATTVIGRMRFGDTDTGWLQEKRRTDDRTNTQTSVVRIQICALCPSALRRLIHSAATPKAKD